MRTNSDVVFYPYPLANRWRAKRKTGFHVHFCDRSDTGLFGDPEPRYYIGLASTRVFDTEAQAVDWIGRRMKHCRRQYRNTGYACSQTTLTRDDVIAMRTHKLPLYNDKRELNFEQIGKLPDTVQRLRREAAGAGQRDNDGAPSSQ